jgi:hypothetical protein
MSVLPEDSSEPDTMSRKLQMYEGLRSCHVFSANGWSHFFFLFSVDMTLPVSKQYLGRCHRRMGIHEH